MVDNQPAEGERFSKQQLIATLPTDSNIAYLRATCNFENRVDTATFEYSTDGTIWNPIGRTLQMVYRLDHFMGQRFALFFYSTKQTGGYADFDWFKVE